MSPFLRSDDAEVVRRTPDANLHPVLRPGCLQDWAGGVHGGVPEGLPYPILLPFSQPRNTTAGGHGQVY